VFRTAGETETTQENIQNWFPLDEGDSGVQLLRGKEIAAVIFLCILISTTIYIIKLSIYLNSFLSFRAIFLSFASSIRIIA
jgi:hypothetical protein